MEMYFRSAQVKKQDVTVRGDTLMCGNGYTYLQSGIATGVSSDQRCRSVFLYDMYTEHTEVVAHCSVVACSIMSEGVV